MNKVETLKRDNLIVKIIKNHKGIKNGIKSNEIARYLSEHGYDTKATSIHIIITKLIEERDLPIVSSSSFGYCWGTCREDFLIAITELQSKIVELSERVEHLKTFII